MKIPILFLFVLTSLQHYSQPALAWAKQFGSAGSDIGRSITVDASGNIYTAGGFHGSVDFDPGAGTAMLTSAGNEDIFISKLDASGNFVWAKQLGGSGNESAYCLKLDGTGNIYVAGKFEGTSDFDPGASSNNLTSFSSGFDDAFVCKLDASGNLIWARQLGGTSNDVAKSLVTNSAGEVFVAGYFFGTADFDPGTGTQNFTSSGMGDVFVTKLDASGNFAWTKQIGGNLYDSGNALTLDASGNILITGFFNSTVDFDPGAGAFNMTTFGAEDVFVAKLDASGNFIWAKQVGGTLYDDVTAITTDASTNIYLTGYFSDVADFDPDAAVQSFTASGAYDGFILKLNSTGSFSWMSPISGSNIDCANGIVSDGSGNIYTTGFFTGTVDFDPGSGIYNLSASPPQREMFVSKLTSAGAFVSAVRIGGSSEDEGVAVAIDQSNNIYTSGYFSSSPADFDPGTGTVNLNASSDDVFVLKLSQNPSGIIEHSLSNKLKVYPNPFTDFLQIETELNCVISVYNALGELLESYVPQGHMETDLSMLPPGIYILKAGTAIQKVIKK